MIRNSLFCSGFRVSGDPRSCSHADAVQFGGCATPWSTVGPYVTAPYTVTLVVNGGKGGTDTASVLIDLGP